MGIYRKTTKDRPAWAGQEVVQVADIEHGKVMVQWQTQNIEFPSGSTRRTMVVATFFFDTTFQTFPAHQHATVELISDTLDTH